MSIVGDHRSHHRLYIAIDAFAEAKTPRTLTASFLQRGAVGIQEIAHSMQT
jgi:hypothetical protein